MFKKRLKGLLAMVLAGSIAATALPLSASATIIGDINVCDSDGNNPASVPYSDIATNEATSSYLNSNNLWAILYTDTDNSTGFITMKLECVEGDRLAEHVTTMHNSSSNSYSDVKIKSEHKYIVTTADPDTTGISTDSQETVSSFPLNRTLGFDTNDPLMESSWTVWYGTPSGGNTIVASSAEKGTTKSISAGSTSISVPMDTFKALSEVDRFLPSDKFGRVVTIIQLQNSYKTLDLKIMNAVGAWERNADNSIKTIPITNEIGDIDGSNKFYLCYKDGSFKKISDGSVDNKTALWTNIESFAGEITNFNADNLYLLRDVLVKVDGDSTDGQFTSKDLFECEDGTTTNAALSYMLNANANSIWGISGNYFSGTYYILQVNLAQKFGEILHSNPDETTIWLNEITSVYVTGEVPIAYDTIPEGSYFESPLLKNGSPATISNHAAKLTVSNPPASGKKYDTTGWQLWKGGKSGSSFQFDSQINVGTGVNSIGIEQIQAAGGADLIIYFPQVDAPSSGGGNGGSSSRPTTPAYDPDKPMIDGEEKSWSDVARDIGKMTEGENKMIYLGGDKKIPADVIKAIKDSKAIITFRISTAFSWTVDGSTLTDGDIHDYDFSIEVITATGVEILRGDIGVGFKIGDISDGATLNINFKKEHAQKFANLYKKVDGELVFVDNVKIDENGSAIGLKVSESGEYVVMLGKFSDRSGDMDNDGILNAKDSLAVLKDFLGIESGTNPVVSDVNKDGAINSKDALEILKMFLGLE